MPVRGKHAASACSKPACNWALFIAPLVISLACAANACAWLRAFSPVIVCMGAAFLERIDILYFANRHPGELASQPVSCGSIVLHEPSYARRSEHKGSSLYYA